MNSIEEFNTYGCVKVENLIDPQTISIVSQYFENRIKREEWKELPDDPTTRFGYYADPLIEVILLNAEKSVGETIGRELIPTYSYSRVYQPGESLRPHVDRPACEISVTVNVATTGEFSPIYMQYGPHDPMNFTLNPGDAVIYKGCEAIHWRKQLKENQLNVQFMLHYVDKNGPNVDHAKDKRLSYGMDPYKRSN